MADRYLERFIVVFIFSYGRTERNWNNEAMSLIWLISRNNIILNYHSSFFILKYVHHAEGELGRAEIVSMVRLQLLAAFTTTKSDS